MIKDRSGNLCIEEEDIKKAAVDFYKFLFCNDGVSPCVLKTSTTFSRIPRSEMEVAFLPVTDIEIKKVVFSMGATKAPGVDGFPAIFYQKH
ncbi:hypothetical protein M5689_007136 [Euphorbia peplus]|nr:hypothetical protein M5689_007136 [Euphorbia peplus]